MPDSEAAGRLQFLSEVGPLLWPAPATVELLPSGTRRSRPSGATEFLLLAGVTRPRLLVPLSNRRAAAAAVRRYGEHSGARARAVNYLLRAAVLSGAARRLPFDRVRVERPHPVDDLEAHLAEVFGKPVLVSLHLSGARANRKPVVQVLDASGETLAFVKIGIEALTCRLVDHEAAALASLDTVPRDLLVVPRVLSHHRWHDLTMLVLAPLPVDQARTPDRGQRARALLELTRAGRTVQPLRDAEWWSRLRARLQPLEERAAGRRLVDVARLLEECAGDRLLDFAPAHGDWTAWNTAVTPTGVLAWDWERFDRSVPVGYDQLHFDLQDRTVGRGEDRAAAARNICRTAPEVLAEAVPDRENASVVVAAYLIDIACRYLTERQEEAGAAAGRVEDWILPALEAHTGTLAESMTGGTRADR